MFHVGQLVMISPHVFQTSAHSRDLPPALAGIPLRITEVQRMHLLVEFANPASPRVQALPHTFITGWVHEYYVPFAAHLYRRP